MALRCRRRLLLLALNQELAEALFLLGLDARQFLHLCSFGDEQRVEVADFACGSLSLALFLAMMPWQMWICMLGGLVFTMAEGVRSRWRALVSMSARVGGLSGMALSCSKRISASWRLASRASRTQSGLRLFGSTFVMLAASSTSMGVAAEDDEGAVLAVFFPLQLPFP